MKERNLSCVDCGVCVCSSEDGTYPGFCLTANMDEAVKAEIMERYDDEVNRKVMQTAAAVEYEGYCRWPRVQETVEFAKRMGFHKIGIATCVGLIRESRALARVLRSHGFEVYGIGCKIGAVPKTDVGIDRACSAVGSNMCNPIMQAELLNREGTELNIVVGLCVGHDSLFYKYSQAVTTTLITKDRVTGHNPAAALYNLDSYYGRLLEDE